MAPPPADIPIPSIEGPVDHDQRPERGLWSAPSDGNRSPSPSSPIATPAHSSPASDRNRSNSPRETPTRNTSSILANDLSNVHLSTPRETFDMSQLAQAVNLAARPPGREISLSPSPNIYDATPRNSLPCDANDPNPKREAPGTLSPPQQRSRRGDTRPHRVNDEEPPSDALHSAQFEQTLDNSKTLMSDMKEVLQSSFLHTDPESTIHKLHQEAADLASFQYPSTRTVGLVGDSGVGKSSLINSLLDERDLARTSNSGEACTCVVTEYRHHEHRYMNISVVLFTDEELCEQLRALLRSYRHFHFHQDEIEADDRLDAEKKAKLGWDTFSAIFRERLGDGNLLLEGTERAVLERLTVWMREAIPSRNALESTGLTREACSARLMELSSESQDRNQRAPWPFIKVIKVFLNAHILNTGLVLVDLPGLRDLNSARQAITERYLIDCNEVLVVCHIGRAVTDEGVNSVFQLAQRTGLRNIGIVCTRSEDIRPEEAVRDWKGERAAAIRRMMHAVETAERDLEHTTTELEEYSTDDEASEEEARLNRVLRSIKRRKAEHAFELLSYMMHSRNDFVTQNLREEYNDRVPGEDIKVFCVSNRLYWDHRERPRRGSLPYLQLSGIIATRRHCLSIVASSQRRAVRHYVDAQIPSFLAQVDHWVQSGSRSGSAERREAIRQILDQVESRLTRSLTSRTSATSVISSTANRHFNDHIYARRNIATWSRSAQGAAGEWSGWAHGTYSAFCRNYGDYSTPAVGGHDWNAEAIATMVQDLEGPWESLVNASNAQQIALAEAVVSAGDAAIEGLEVEFEGNLDAPASLTQMMTTQQRMLLDAVERAQEQLEADISLVRINALSSIRSSLIGKAMDASYRACQQESGRGSDSRRKAIIRGTLSNETLFRTLMSDFRELFRMKTAQLEESVSTSVSLYLETVRVNFDLVRSENAVREGEQDPGFRDRVTQAVQVSWQSSRQSRDAIDV